MRETFLGFLAGTGLIAFLLNVGQTSPGTTTAQTGSRLMGGGSLGEAKESIKYSTYQGHKHDIGVQRLGVVSPPGKLIHVSSNESGKYMLWFEDTKGVVRNMVLGTRLYKIHTGAGFSPHLLLLS